MRRRAIYVVGNVCFVAHPAVHGVWLKTDPSVAKIRCKHCESDIGVPCVGKRGYGGSTHHVRRHDAKLLPRAHEHVTIHYRPI